MTTNDAGLQRLQKLRDTLLQDGNWRAYHAMNAAIWAYIGMSDEHVQKEIVSARSFDHAE